MKVYLLNPPYLPHFGRSMRWQDTGRGGTLYYPIWLAYATAVLEQENEVRLVDAPAWNWGTEEVLADLSQFQPDMVVMDTSFPSLANDIAKANQIKEAHPNCQIAVMGPPASQFAPRLLENPGIDIIVRYEPDFSLQEVAQALASGGSLEPIRGISYKQDGKIYHNPERGFSTSQDLDKIPFVSQVYKKHLKVKDYFLGTTLYPEVQIFTGRGCPFFCTFCSWPQTLMGRKYRTRSILNVLDELEWIQQNLPEVKEVFLEDDTFTIDYRRVREFCQQYRQRGLDIIWSCNARATLDEVTMKEMKQANCRLLIAGYESGNAEMLKRMRKGITLEQMRSFARHARRAGLLVQGDFIIGLPGETRETIEDTARFINEARPDILQVSVATPFPGTEFYQWVKERGFLLTEDPDHYLDEQGHQKAVVSYPGLSARDIEQTVDRLLKGYYLSPRYVPLALKQLFRRGGVGELRRMWYSAKGFALYLKGRNHG